MMRTAISPRLATSSRLIMRVSSLSRKPRARRAVRRPAAAWSRRIPAVPPWAARVSLREPAAPAPRLGLRKSTVTVWSMTNGSMPDMSRKCQPSGPSPRTSPWWRGRCRTRPAAVLPEPRPAAGQVGGLLALAPVGELHAAQLVLVGIRRDLDDGLVGPQGPAQVQRGADQPPHLRLGQVALGVRRHGQDRDPACPRPVQAAPPWPAAAPRPRAPPGSCAPPPPGSGRSAPGRCAPRWPSPPARARTPTDQVLHRTPALHRHLPQRDHADTTSQAGAPRRSVTPAARRIAAIGNAVRRRARKVAECCCAPRLAVLTRSRCGSVPQDGAAGRARAALVVPAHRRGAGTRPGPATPAPARLRPTGSGSGAASGSGSGSAARLRPPASGCPLALRAACSGGLGVRARRTDSRGRSVRARAQRARAAARSAGPQARAAAGALRGRAPGRAQPPGAWCSTQGRLDHLQAPLGLGPPGELGPRQHLRHLRGVVLGELQPDGDRIRLGPPRTCHAFKVPRTAALTEHGHGCLK